MKKKRKTIVEIIIRAVFFLVYPAVFSTAFSGIKFICQQFYKKELLEMNTFLMVLIMVLVFSIIFGRFFCGFACAFGTYGDVIFGIWTWIRKKRKKKPFSLSERITGKLRYLKYVVLLVIILICVAGKTEYINDNSVWSVFSQLQAGKFSTTGNKVGIILFLIITVGMVLQKRFFCRFLCPMGAVFSLLPVFPLFGVKRNRENCIRRCQACKNKCPAGIELPSTEEGDNAQMGECFSCGKCMDICPKGNVHIGMSFIKGNEFWLQIIKATILLALCYLLKI